jgi:hypothetical protein
VPVCPEYCLFPSFYFGRIHQDASLGGRSLLSYSTRLYSCPNSSQYQPGAPYNVGHFDFLTQLLAQSPQKFSDLQYWWFSLSQLERDSSLLRTNPLWVRINEELVLDIVAFVSVVRLVSLTVFLSNLAFPLRKSSDVSLGFLG